jgi:hypothetical protein
MAGNSNTGVSVVTATTSANNVDLVWLTGHGFSVKVTNLNGGPPLYWTVDSPGGACPVPTIGGINTYCSASVAGNVSNSRAADMKFGSIVQLVSAGVTQYMVELQSVRATS